MTTDGDYEKPAEDFDDSSEWGEPVPGTPNKSVDAVFSVRLSRDTAARLRAAARAAGVPTSRFAREIVEGFLDSSNNSGMASGGGLGISTTQGTVSFYAVVMPRSGTVTRAGSEVATDDDKQLALA